MKEKDRPLSINEAYWGKKIKPDSDLGNAEDWENVAIQQGDELSKIHTVVNTTGQKVQFPNKSRTEEKEKGKTLWIKTAICRAYLIWFLKNTVEKDKKEEEKKEELWNSTCILLFNDIKLLLPFY